MYYIFKYLVVIFFIQTHYRSVRQTSKGFYFIRHRYLPVPVEGREKKTPHRIGFLVVRYLTEEFRVVKGDFNVVSVVRCLDVFPPFSANKNWTSR